MGADTVLKRLRAWANRVGYDKPHHNSNPETYVWIHDYSVMGSQFLDVFTKFKLNPGKAVQEISQSQGYIDALRDCFPASKYPKQKEVINNFHQELMAQVIIGKVGGNFAALLGPKGANLLTKGGARVAPKAATYVSKPIQSRLPSSVSKMKDWYKNTFPKGVQRPLTGAVRLAAIVYLGNAIYDLYVRGGNEFLNTGVAILKGKGKDEVAATFKKDLSNAMDKSLKEMGLGNEDMIKALQESIGKIKTIRPQKVTELTNLLKRIEGTPPGHPSLGDLRGRAQKIKAFLERLDGKEEELVIILASFQDSDDVLEEIQEDAQEGSEVYSES